jgi:hypothetical protein
MVWLPGTVFAAVADRAKTLYERPAAAREGGAIHGTWSARDEADQAGFESIRRPARAWPEPVGRPLGEHGERGSGPMILPQTEARADLL